MELASAYPNSDIPAGTMTLIAVVMAAVLVIWLVSVYLAERSTQARARQARNSVPVPASATSTADDEHSGASGTGQAGRPAAAA